ncbi:MAG: MerR family transcriptional regulator [Candidatus Dormibacteraeota bacterium]|nr:MerR family transcriptional regulator [Candidatus Dormibacteraeota bacterium]
MRATQSVANQEDQAVYSIGAVAHMLDIPTSTLRGWEERYGVVTPDRSQGSQRLYSRSQVEHLRFVKAQIESGNSAADAHRLLAQHLSSGPVRIASVEPKGERRILILLAERDAYAADLAEYFLRTEGYDVCIALDATQARVLFDERSPDLVVIDLLISGGAGFRLCAEFTAKASAPVLAVASIDQPEEALRSGAAAFLAKPLEPLQLVSTVRDLLGTSALVRHARRAEVTH